MDSAYIEKRGSYGHGWVGLTVDGWEHAAADGRGGIGQISSSDGRLGSWANGQTANISYSDGERAHSQHAVGHKASADYQIFAMYSVIFLRFV